jgi:LPXTG-motif cell wall-anchored protein
MNVLPKTGITMPKNFLWILAIGAIGYLLYRNIHRN